QHPETMRLTGHQRDLNQPTTTEDDLDYMHARYYGTKMGRFVSVDPGSDVSLRVPRSWNLYAYVRGNPVRFSDDTGEGMRDRLLGTVQGFLGSVSFGTIPNTAPSPLDTPDQREGQLWGAALAAWAGLETGKAGVALAVAGGAGEVLTAGSGTAVAVPVVATGAVLAGVGAAVVAGSASYFASTATATETSGGDLEKVSDRELKRRGIDAHELKQDLVPGQVSRYDVFKNKKTGELFLVRKGRTNNPPIPTGERIMKQTSELRPGDATGRLP
ncbi:MAG TPA: RHS repeat-associated core domain-containing protein, partial [Thermoanaerobaculaceae bacterium]|nr:RHS repeat-associated core domain-containing protein [Thermoanaerobaculaceae bacterium]